MKIENEILIDPFNSILQHIEEELKQLPAWKDRKEREGAEVAFGRIAQFIFDHGEELRLSPGPKSLKSIKESVEKGLEAARKADHTQELSPVIDALEDTFTQLLEQLIPVFVGIYAMSFRTDEQIVTMLKRYRDVIASGAHTKRFGPARGMVC